ncbi:MAG: glucan biosynthesis protein [Opitutaceae bacterium]|nr:glucan biosynthesis protein [Opitutaceae bacterium]
MIAGAGRTLVRRWAERSAAGHCLVGLLALTGAGDAAGAGAAFDFEMLQFRAKALAARPYEARPSHVPSSLQKYDYDEYRKIEFNRERAWWHGDRLPFELQFFHPGGIYSKDVRINQLVGADVSRINFSRQMFTYGGRKPWLLPSDMGFAGFRILHPLNRPDKWDEIAVFLGASYFRALGQGQHYGLSARGLALNSGGPVPEEFPIFEEFWVQRPAPDAATVTVYALLDGPSVAGAFRFVIRPGADTVMNVRAAVYFRKDPGLLGLAPLTSMFAHGENSGWARDDFRPEVHDSDGLLLAAGTGEWIWRPLENPRTVRNSTFLDRSPRGFGLMQRDRAFAHYDDLEAYYHERPSAWVEPVGDWGPGSIRLVELPTADETADNIVAFWVPAKLPPAGEALAYEYNLRWMSDPGRRPPGGYVLSTRSATVPGRPGLRRFVLEFGGAYLDVQPNDPEIEAVVTVGPGARQAGPAVVQKNPFSGAWRVVFELAAGADPAPVELRCFLRKGPHVLTETWSLLWTP